jgi:hypothetical protein
MISRAGDIAEHLFGFPVDLDAKPLRKGGDRANSFSLARKHLEDSEQAIWELPGPDPENAGAAETSHHDAGQAPATEGEAQP